LLRTAIWLFSSFLSKSLLESGSMALHRDIYWVGRQWAVTGFGVQAVDQRLKGEFDIDVSRVWDDELQARMRGHAWVNADDFDKALTMARRRFPEPAKRSLSPSESLPEPPPLAAIAAEPPISSPENDTSPPLAGKSVSPERAQTAPPPLQLRLQGRLARFVPQWRVRR
jgi:hypothetical protein